MITMLDILQYERLSGRSFIEFGANEDDIIIMMYCHDHTLQRKHTLEVYRQTFEDFKQKAWAQKEISRFTSSVQRDIEFTRQFVKKKNNERKSSHDDDTELTRLTPLILLFLMDGINPDWLLTQGVEWMDILAEAHELKRNERYKYDRYWHSIYFGFQYDKKHHQDYMKLLRSLQTDEEREKAGKPRMTEAQEISIGHILWGKKE